MFGIIWRSVSWLKERISQRAQRMLIRVLAAGPVPQHVAFIMDGNRRYARRRNQQVKEGHFQGYVALRRVLEICLRLNVRCVSVYAFAIDNFKRSPEEVDALLNLAQQKLTELCQHGDLLDEYGVRLNILGRKELFPESIQKSMQAAEDMTRHNNKAILNVCMAYSSTDEMTTAIERAVNISLKDGSYITEEAIELQLMTSLVGSPPLDIIIRSSGVRRLSDFLLWQGCSDAQIHFCDTYWPDFGLRDFVPILLNYQRKIWSR